MVSRQEVKPDSQSLGESALSWRREKTELTLDRGSLAKPFLGAWLEGVIRRPQESMTFCPFREPESSWKREARATDSSSSLLGFLRAHS